MSVKQNRFTERLAIFPLWYFDVHVAFSDVMRERDSILEISSFSLASSPIRHSYAVIRSNKRAPRGHILVDVYSFSNCLCWICFVLVFVCSLF